MASPSKRRALGELDANANLNTSAAPQSPIKPSNTRSSTAGRPHKRSFDDISSLPSARSPRKRQKTTAAAMFPVACDRGASTSSSSGHHGPAAHVLLPSPLQPSSMLTTAPALPVAATAAAHYPSPKRHCPSAPMAFLHSPDAPRAFLTACASSPTPVSPNVHAEHPHTTSTYAPPPPPSGGSPQNLFACLDADLDSSHASRHYPYLEEPALLHTFIPPTSPQITPARALQLSYGIHADSQTDSLLHTNTLLEEAAENQLWPEYDDQIHAEIALRLQAKKAARQVTRERAQALRLRLSLATYKVRTGQTNVPLEQLKVHPDATAPHTYSPLTHQHTPRRSSPCSSIQVTAPALLSHASPVQLVGAPKSTTVRTSSEATCALQTAPAPPPPSVNSHRVVLCMMTLPGPSSCLTSAMPPASLPLRQSASAGDETESDVAASERREDDLDADQTEPDDDADRTEPDNDPDQTVSDDDRTQSDIDYASEAVDAERRVAADVIMDSDNNDYDQKEEDSGAASGQISLTLPA